MKYDRIKELRDDRNVSQQELAEIIGVAQSSIGNYERGERIPDADVIVKLADFFKVSTDYILGRIDSKQLENAPINEVLGLNDEAIDKLEFIRKHGKAGEREALNLFIVNEFFRDLLLKIWEFASYTGKDDEEFELRYYSPRRTLEIILSILHDQVKNHTGLLQRIEEINHGPDQEA